MVSGRCRSFAVSNLPLIFFLHLVSQPINTIKYKLQRMSIAIAYGGDK